MRGSALSSPVHLRPMPSLSRGKGQGKGGRGKGAGKKKKPLRTKAGSLTVTEVAELEDLRKELERTARGATTPRWNANPDDVQRSVAQLVLTLVEFIRRLLE